MAALTLTKHHGLGNDFLVVVGGDGVNGAVLRAPARERGRGVVRRRCAPAPGIGADGLLVATEPDDAERAAAGADGRHAALQRRRQHGRDERQRHPLPGPGAGPLLAARTQGAVSRRHRGRPPAGDVRPRCRAATRWSPASTWAPVTLIEAPTGLAGRRPPTSTGRSPTSSVGNPHPVVAVEDVAAVDLRHRRPARARRQRRDRRGRARAIGHHHARVRAGRGSPRPAAPARARPPWPRRAGASSAPAAVKSPCTWTAAMRGYVSTTPSQGGSRSIGPATFVGAVAGRAVTISSDQEDLEPRELRRGARRHAHRAERPGADRARRRHAPAGTRPTTTEADARRAGAAGRHRRCRRGRPRRAAARPARPGHLRRQGQGRGAPRAVPGRRRRHRRLRRRAHPGPAAQPREAARAHRHRPHRGDPRHLRPERPQPGGQGPGRAGAAPLPAAPAPRGREASAVPAGRRHRHPAGAGRDAARDRPAPHHAADPQARGTTWPICSATASSSAEAAAGAVSANVAIVGYTNAGKSTLLNRLTDAGVLVEDRLFATLDATTRRLPLPGGETVLLTDTVGFVRKLPHHLVEAFKSTLEVVAEADLLVHVVDAARPDPEAQIDAVRARARRDRRRRGARAARLQQGRPGARGGRRLVERHPGSVARLGGDRRGRRRAAAAARRPPAAPRPTSSSCSSPTTGATCSPRVHREGEVLVERAPRTPASASAARLEPAAGGAWRSSSVRDAALAGQPAALPAARPVTTADR